MEKERVREYNKEYYAKNSEKRKAQIYAWRDKNKEEVNRKQREKIQNMSEEERAERNRLQRERRAVNVEESRAKYREYYYKRKERIKNGQ